MYFHLCYVMGIASESCLSVWPQQEPQFSCINSGGFSVFTSVKWENNEVLSDALQCFIHHLDY